MQSLTRGVGTVALVFILFFCTSGGPYTTETLIHQVGPGLGLLILILVPLIWSLPEVLIIVALARMISALALFNALLLSYSRIPFVLAHDRLLPHSLGKIDNRGTPRNAV